MGDGHHTVLPACKEVVRLALPPVLINQIIAISPLEVFLHCPIIETNPGVVMTKTIDKLLFRVGEDATEVGAVLSAVFLCILPGVSVGEVPVAVAVKLPPSVLTTFNVFLTSVSSVAWQAKTEEGINFINASPSVFTRLGLAVINVDLAVLSGVSLWTVAAVSRSLRKALSSMQTRVCHAGLQPSCWIESCGAGAGVDSSSVAFFLHIPW